MYNYKSTHSAITPLTLLPIANTLGGTTTAAVSINYIKVYLAIAVSIYINIVHKRVTDIVKDV
jgi:hypothetical protein